MRLLDLFCGAGGAAMGYYRAGFTDIVGVDHKPQKRYPFEFVQADALEYVAEYGSEFDLIHASPPCQRFSVATPMTHRTKHPDLIAPTREAILAIGRPFIIENVPGARRELKGPLVMLCGSMFGLAIRRHRYFEVSPSLAVLTPPCDHSKPIVYITGSTGSSGCGFPRKDASKDDKCKAIGIDWMVTSELDEAIPPAYTEWLGRRILEAPA